MNQQPRRGRWIESTEPRIILFLSALQKINLIESKLSPVFCVYMTLYACSELIGPPIRKKLPWQICYLVNFIVISLPRNSQVNKTVKKILSVRFQNEYYLIVFCFQCELFAAKNIQNSHPSLTVAWFLLDSCGIDESASNIGILWC